MQVRDDSLGEAVLRVLEKATQNRPEARYQTVEEFWDDIADASLPATRPLQMVPAGVVQEMRRKPSEDLSVEPEEEFTEAAPPRPHFEVPKVYLPELDTAKAPAHRGSNQSRSTTTDGTTCPPGAGGGKRERRPERITSPVDSVLPREQKASCPRGRWG